jgi:hypothetical protein
LGKKKKRANQGKVENIYQSWAREKKTLIREVMSDIYFVLLDFDY